MAKQNFIVWYTSSSHGCRRYFLGVSQRRTPAGVIPYPAWINARTNADILSAKSQAYYFENINDARGCVAFCGKCGYKDLTIEPIDIPDIFVPSVSAINCKPPEAST